jgi:hypothetical protein
VTGETPKRRGALRLRKALALAKRGLPVHPCRPNSKLPALNNWPEQATVDPEQIRTWWSWWPRADVAIMCGGPARLLVVDVDPAAGGRLDKVDQEGEYTLPPTVMVSTPSGGVHVWLRVPKGRELPGNSVAKLGPGIDTRCTRGYVLCPPSIINGRAYRWHPDCGDRIAEGPAWLVDRLEQVGNGQGASPEEWVEMLVAGVDEGERNHSIARLAGKLFRHLPAHDAMMVAELVACWNAQRCRPPLEAEELQRTLDSIAAAEMRRRGVS